MTYLLLVRRDDEHDIAILIGKHNGKWCFTAPNGAFRFGISGTMLLLAIKTALGKEPFKMATAALFPDGSLRTIRARAVTAGGLAHRLTSQLEGGVL